MLIVFLRLVIHYVNYPTKFYTSNTLNGNFYQIVAVRCCSYEVKRKCDRGLVPDTHLLWGVKRLSVTTVPEGFSYLSGQRGDFYRVNRVFYRVNKVFYRVNSEFYRVRRGILSGQSIILSGQFRILSGQKGGEQECKKRKSTLLALLALPLREVNWEETRRGLGESPKKHRGW